MPELLAACLILAIAEAVYGLLGFGAGLIAVGALALFMPELRDRYTEKDVGAAASARLGDRSHDC